MWVRSTVSFTIYLSIYLSILLLLNTMPQSPPKPPLRRSFLRRGVVCLFGMQKGEKVGSNEILGCSPDHTMKLGWAGF